MKYDIIIVGAGLAGLYTALSLNNDLNICILNKSELGNSNTELAQGGIAAVLEKSDEELKSHIEDTLIAGSNLNNLSSTSKLVNNAEDNINNLIKLGIKFDKDNEGNFKLTKEGGHSKNRILHAGGDATGKVIIEALIKRIKAKENVNIIENAMLTSLIIEDNECKGVTYLKDNFVQHIFSSKTIFCTGGIGSLYLNSTNPLIATADGLAVCIDHNVKIENMEFIQFHPTALYSNNPGQQFLISEAVRGEGAKLININKEPFMHKYDDRLELAPRDVVSQSIHREMYDTWSDYIYLDITSKSEEFLKNRFPTIFKRCLDLGLNMSKDLIPVVPVEHYCIGGIKVDEFGHTSLKNLYANGEVASNGVHGANRLASNSLLECIVFGDIIAKEINNLNLQDITYKKKYKDFKVKETTMMFSKIKEDINQNMDKYVGIVRNTEGLNIALKIVTKHLDNLEKLDLLTKEYIEVLNIAKVSKEIILSALERKDSLGCHYRID